MVAVISVNIEDKVCPQGVNDHDDQVTSPPSPRPGLPDAHPVPGLCDPGDCGARGEVAG